MEEQVDTTLQIFKKLRDEQGMRLNVNLSAVDRIYANN
jgi:glycine C-acetyltransferase